MGDYNSNLPPGFRFYPNDEEFVVHFLQRKAALLPCNPDVIPDLALYPYDPWELDAKFGVVIRVGESDRPDYLARLLRLVRRCGNVKNVYFDERFSKSPSGRMDEYCLSDAALTTVGGAKIERLSLILCSYVTTAGLISVAERCPSLKSLDLQVSNAGDEALAAIVEGYQKLEHLNLRLCKVLSDTGLSIFASHGTSLKSLGVSSCKKITNGSLYAIGKGCRSLTKLTFSGCPSLSDEGLEAVAAGCSELMDLEVSDCRNIGTRGLEFVGDLVDAFRSFVKHLMF